MFILEVCYTTGDLVTAGIWGGVLVIILILFVIGLIVLLRLINKIGWLDT